PRRVERARHLAVPGRDHQLGPMDHRSVLSAPARRAMLGATVLVLTFATIACGGGSKSAGSTSTPPTNETTTSNGGTGVPGGAGSGGDAVDVSTPQVELKQGGTATASAVQPGGRASLRCGSQITVNNNGGASLQFASAATCTLNQTANTEASVITR